jgi:hypothetical protein
MTMSETKGRIHLAVGVFYELDRLQAASSALIAAGMSRSDLWRVVACDRDCQGPARCGIRFDRLSAGAEHDDDVEAGSAHNPCPFFSDVMMSGAPGTEIWQHLAQNATVVAAENENADLHVRCMKILLRHSKHPVHSREFELPKASRQG